MVVAPYLCKSLAGRDEGLAHRFPYCSVLEPLLFPYQDSRPSCLLAAQKLGLPPSHLAGVPHHLSRKPACIERIVLKTFSFLAAPLISTQARLVPDLTSESCGNNQVLCIENGIQTQRHRSPVDRFQPVVVACKERQRGDRWPPLFMRDTQGMNSTVIETPRPPQVQAEDSPGN